MKQSTSERIAEALIGDIREGRLRPGDRIREQDLAARFSTSRGPVREALRGLTSQFWLTHEVGKGVKVTELDNKDAPDATFIGRALNGVAARFAASRATDADLQAFDRQAAAVADAALGDATPEQFSELTWTLGRLMFKVARSPLLEEMNLLQQRGGLIRIAHTGVRNRQQRIDAARLWVDLAVALRRRDPDSAERTIRGVIDRSLNEVMRAKVHPNIFDATSDDRDAFD